MRRNNPIKGGGGGGRRHKNARTPQDGATVTTAAAGTEPDDWHNSDSPSCRRLATIAHKELALETPGAVAQTGFPNLVRDYVVWARPTYTTALSSSSTNTGASKKKKKKKKKKKAGTGAAAGAGTSKEEIEESTAAASRDDEDDEDEAPPAPEKSWAQSSPSSSGAVPQPAPAASMPPTTAIQSQSETWESLRLHRRREWADRFVEYHRQQLADQDTPTPTTVEKILQDLDKFLAWLSSSPNPNSSTETSNRNNIARLNGESTGRGTGVGLVPFTAARVQQAVECISCMDCRYRVKQNLETPIVLSGSQEVDDMTNLFQYRAMEEGDGRALPPHTLTLLPPSAEQPSWRLERADGSPVVWTREAFDFWLQEYILLGGLGYDKVIVGPTGMTELTEERSIEIHDSLSRAGAELAGDSNQVSNLLEKQVFGFKKLPRDDEPVDVNGPPKLWDIDVELTAILGRIMRIVLRITNAHQRVAVYQTQVARQTGREIPIMTSRLMADGKAIVHLWDVFLMKFQKIFQLIAGFENKYVALADGQGQIPHLFYNRSARQWFKDYVNEKIITIHGMLADIMKAADGQDDSIETCTTVFRLSLGRSAAAMDDFLRVAVPDHEKVTSRDELDEACEDVLYILNEWSEHLRQNVLDKFINEHEQRRIRLAGAFDRAGKIMQMKMNDLEADNPDSKSIGIIYQAWARRDLHSITIEDTSSLRKAREIVLTKTGAMIQVWLKLGRNRDVGSTTYPSQHVAMHLDLLRWTATGRHTDPQNGVCVYGAESRAGCIVSSLIFDWMSTRYSEWQAELAEHELLVDLTSNTGTSTWSQVARGAKRVTKKKAAAVPAPKMATAPPSSKADKTEDANSADTVVPPTKAVTEEATHESNEKAVHDTQLDPSNGKYTPTGSGTSPVGLPETEQSSRTPPAVHDGQGVVKKGGTKDNPTSEPSETPISEHPANGQNGKAPDTLAEDLDRSNELSGEAPLSAEELDANIGMVVVDRSGCQSAHDFFLSRYLEVIDASKKGTKANVVKIL
eukprot:scaffold10827_cov161-Amphora_coffeaeformis.AAC.1